MDVILTVREIGVFAVASLAWPDHRPVWSGKRHDSAERVGDALDEGIAEATARKHRIVAVSHQIVGVPPPTGTVTRTMHTADPRITETIAAMQGQQIGQAIADLWPLDPRD